MSELDDREVHLQDALLSVLARLNDGDVAARMPSHFTRDTDRRIADLVNSLADSLAQVISDRQNSHGRLEADVWELSELFLRLAQGDFSVRSHRGDTGEPMDVLSYLFDKTVSDIAALFSEVKSQRTVVDSMLNSMVDAVFLLSPKGDIQKANESASKMLGWSSEEFIGTSFQQLLAPRDQAFFRDLRERVLVRNRDTLFQTRTGELIPLVLSGSAVKSEDAGLLGIVLSARDDRELRKAQSQLQMADRLATMGSLAAGVAHEINNPLSFVVSNLEYAMEELAAVAEDERIPVATRREIEAALLTSCKGSERVAGIVRDLKSISRVESDSLTSVVINSLLDSAAAMLRHEIRHRAILTRDYGSELLVHANEARVMQIFLNLLQNAAQALPVGSAKGNEIILRTRLHDDSCVLIEVVDTGCGIPEEDLATIFDEFFTTKDIGVGTGLGLSICKRLVEQMHGRIEVSSTMGQGTSVRVFLPLARQPAATPVAAEREAVASSVKRHRVLILDDEPEVGEAVRRLIHKEYDVDIASSGSDALALFRLREHDIILCDIMMPEMSGPTFLRALEDEFPERSARIIFMTGGEFALHENSGLPRSSLSLQKPFSPKELRAILASARK